MPFLSDPLKIEYINNSMNSALERTKFMYDESIYSDAHGNIQALRPFSFPLDADFPEINWLEYHPATEKSPEKWVVLEPELCYKLRKTYHLNRINGVFYTDSGTISDDKIKSVITDWILPFFHASVSRVAASVFQTLQNICYCAMPTPQTNKVYLSSGHTVTIHDNGNWDAELDFDAVTVNRLPVKYDPDAPCPQEFLDFLDELFYPDDMQMVHEFIGHCLVPSTESQKALAIKGEGGNGKSLFLSVISRLFGNSSTAGKTEELLTNRFRLSTLENRLLYIDDDLTMSKMADTALLKNIITAMIKLQAERKGKDPYEFTPYARFMCAGNEFPSALYDRTNGFYRRWLFVECKPVAPDRKDNPNLLRQLSDRDLSGILNWALAGLSVWASCGKKFNESSRSKAIMEERKALDNPVKAFMEDEDWIMFDSEKRIFSKTLADAFSVWCSVNNVIAPKQSTVSRDISHIAQTKGLGSPEAIRTPDGRIARGYKGVGLTDHAKNEINHAIVTTSGLFVK